MNILLTGGLGYIGSHTAVELLNKGHEVVVIDNLSNSKRSVKTAIEKITGKKIELCVFDLCNKNKLMAFFDNHKIDAVIHWRNDSQEVNHAI